MQKVYPLHWKVLGTVGITALVVLALISGTVTAQNVVGTAPVNSITVSGSGEASGTPDVAYVNLGVDTTDSDVGQAVENANQQIATIIAAIAETGVDEQDIQTTNFYVYPEDRYDQSGQPTGERIYRVQNLLNVTVRDIGNVGAVIDAGLSAGANSVNGLTFGIDDTADLEQEARVNAVEDARQRAQQLAEAFGVTVGEPIIISEVTGGMFPPPVPYLAQDAAIGGAGAQITPGQLQVTVQVNVTFALG